MNKIKIKNFGPIKEGYQLNDGWIDVNKVTLFIGNQGSGKSTIAKLISTFTWIEKALVRGDYDAKWFSARNKLKNIYLKYHRLENYLNDNKFKRSKIEFQGDAYNLKYSNGSLTVNKISKNNYNLPQIMYVPAERNFISYVKKPKAIKLTSDSLIEFVTEFDKAKAEIKSPMNLPVNNVQIEYQKLNDVIFIKGNDYKINLTDASSGFQSIAPLYLVSWYLSNSVKKQSEISKESMSSEELKRFEQGVADIWSNESLTDEQRRVALSVLSAKFNKTAFINIVEEPEQNLYPTSQWAILKSLLEFNNKNKENKLIMTTHSPYIINYLTLIIKAYLVYEKIKKNKTKNELEIKLDKILSLKSLIIPNDLSIYELNEIDGTIKKLSSYQELPSDDNYLNQILSESNDLFDKLLEIEELCL